MPGVTSTSTVPSSSGSSLHHLSQLHQFPHRRFHLRRLCVCRGVRGRGVRGRGVRHLDGTLLAGFVFIGPQKIMVLSYINSINIGGYYVSVSYVSSESGFQPNSSVLSWILPPCYHQDGPSQGKIWSDLSS